MSESLRGYLLRSFMAVYSSFGAADLEINIAAENDFTIGVRRLLRDRREIGEALRLPGHALPMVFQYNPREPTAEFHAACTGPFAGHDIRLKRTYIRSAY